ncbi:hypothetical protein MWMV2_MWMV2_00049 [Acinetobacter oleivorans]|uniref:hypothetical protein n=1 Tax=Acinetobacter TaxID=469 RepID=UPI00124FCF81|nr:MULTISPECIES: hypothetical protein [Acinetobacter]MDS7936007.1 hypothetical protein [Acinetobacter sp. V91_4B]MDS7964385.1 hypothetical protein [Acinetobacter sp. V91_7]MDS8026306.1 hypothetical protein [Acinetobacter sp. V91_13]MDY7371676.1 hypothetical protein [Acinetobacter oleivorans]CAI3100088.1 hypothetical protein MWMV12_MWMV12_00049 [Acinetobacter oleivorans]
MKFYKTAISVYLSILVVGCESIPNDVHSLRTSLNNGIRTLNTGLSNSSSNFNTNKKNSRKGMLTNNQCQNSTGKTKSQIEIIANEKLADTRAYSLNSFAVTYNFQISDRVSRYGVNSESKAICSLTFEGNQLNSKVLYWSIIG